MANPYLDRVVERMRSDNAMDQLRRHWSSRAERLVLGVGCLLDRVSPWCAALYTDATWPLVEWLGDRQRAFLSRWF